MHDSILDQASDQGAHELHRLVQLYDLPEYVKQASDDERTGNDRTPTNAYADYRRPAKFPCHTKAATLVSWAFFLGQKDKMHTKLAQVIEGRLQQMAEFHHITDDVEQLLRKHAEYGKNNIELLPDSAFAIVRTDESGGKERSYPLRHGAEVKAASDWFLEHRDHFVFADRRLIAEKLLEKANQFNVSLGDADETLQRQAGHGWCTPKAAADMLRGRALLAKTGSDFRNRLNTLADTMEKQSELATAGNNLIDLAVLVDNFDKLAKATYGPSLPRPEDVLFAATYKAAAELKDDLCELTTGHIFEKSQLEKLSIGAVRDLFGDALADEVADVMGAVDGEKLASVARTLPAPDAELLVGMMSDIGQTPIAVSR